MSSLPPWAVAGVLRLRVRRGSVGDVCVASAGRAVWVVFGCGARVRRGGYGGWSAVVAFAGPLVVGPSALCVWRLNVGARVLGGRSRSTFLLPVCVVGCGWIGGRGWGGCVRFRGWGLYGRAWGLLGLVAVPFLSGVSVGFWFGMVCVVCSGSAGLVGQGLVLRWRPRGLWFVLVGVAWVALVRSAVPRFSLSFGFLGGGRGFGSLGGVRIRADALVVFCRRRGCLERPLLFAASWWAKLLVGVGPRFGAGLLYCGWCRVAVFGAIAGGA